MRSSAVVLVGIGMVVLAPRAAHAQDAAPEPPPSPETTPPATEAPAPPAPDGAQDLAQQLTNPISDLASIPFQFNWNRGVGSNDDLQLVLNIQPVVPVSLTENWNLIGRYIVPLVAQPALAPGAAPSFGMSDIVFSLFLSPAKTSHLIWGVGPVFGLPMSTDPTLGSGKWQLGPSGVALYITGPWTLGALVNQLWSFANAGDVDRSSVSQMFIQPFVAYTRGSVTLSANSETTINWEASDDKATVPIQLSVSKLTKIGFLPLSVQLGGGWFATAPTGGPDWRLRLAFTVLLPRQLKP